MAGLFITSTGTGIGKTYVTQCLLEWDQSQQRILTASKPVISGWPQNEEDIQHTDTALLLKAQNQKSSPEMIEKCSPWRFCAPCTPEMAAKAEGRTIPLEALIAFCAHQFKIARLDHKIHLVEGAGGVMSPIADRCTGLDWIQALSCPLLLIVGSYLGTLSHTLTAIAALEAKKRSILGVVVSETPESSISLAKTGESLKTYVSTEIVLLPYRKNGYCHEAIAQLYTLILSSGPMGAINL